MINWKTLFKAIGIVVGILIAIILIIVFSFKCPILFTIAFVLAAIYATYKVICDDDVEKETCNIDWKKEELGWRSVKDSLPGPSEWVVVCVRDHNTPQCLSLATYNSSNGKWYTDEFDDGEQEEYFPDYWMPIPEDLPEE